MPKLLLSTEAARRIVRAGSETVLHDVQTLAPPRRAPPPREKWRCWFTNEGRWPIAAGEMAGIVGMTDADRPSAEAIRSWRDSGLRLRVKRIGLVDDANAACLARGVALEDLPVGGTGRGTAPGVFMALIWRDPAVIGESRRFLERADWKTTEWTDPDGRSRSIRRLAFVNYPGGYTVVDAAVPDEDENVFALAVPAPGGPVADRIESVDTSAGTALMACGVTADAPLSTLKVTDAGRRALLFRDGVSRAWHILLKDG